jgi:hypothetical protein
LLPVRVSRKGSGLDDSPGRGSSAEFVGKNGAG